MSSFDREAGTLATPAHRLTFAAILLLLPLLGACASAQSARTREFLDESTGLTLIVVQRPIIFARARTDVAANARDYATLVAMQEDRSGKYSTWLIVHRWSTVDPRFAGDASVGSGQLRIIADDRELTLRPTLPEPAVLQRRAELFGPPGRAVSSAAYAVDGGSLRSIAAAQTLSLRYSDDALPIAYGVWEDGRSALQAWLSDMRPP
jgi:hypothetical protein